MRPEEKAKKQARLFLEIDIVAATSNALHFTTQAVKYEKNGDHANAAIQREARRVAIESMIMSMSMLKKMDRDEGAGG